MDDVIHLLVEGGNVLLWLPGEPDTARACPDEASEELFEQVFEGSVITVLHLRVEVVEL